MFSGVGGFENAFERVSDLSASTWDESGGNQDRGSTCSDSSSVASQQPISVSQSQDNQSQVEGFKSKGDSSGNTTKPLQGTTFSCVGLSEIDKYASELLKQRFPSVKNWGDCTKINPSELPDFDMLCGGFPCQAFSIAGKRRGFQDTRGTLFFEIARILEVKRPKIILLENVKGLLNHNKGETFKVILQTLDELGYAVEWMVLNSKFFGVPQNRERVFIIGSLRGIGRPQILPFRENDGRTDEGDGETPQTQTTPTIDSRVGASTHRSPYIVQLNDPVHSANRVYSEEGIGPGLRTGNQPKIRAVLTPNRAEKRQNGRRFKEDGEPSFTLTGQDVHGVTDGIKIRRLTPTECERLQGFSDGWTEGFSNTQRYRMMGNAVTVNVIQAIASKLCSHNPKEVKK